MKIKSLAAIICIIAVIMPLCAFTCVASQQGGDTVKEAQGLFDGILAYFGISDDSDLDRFIADTLAASPASGNEWYALALMQHRAYDLGAYEAALVGYLEDNTVTSASSRLKFALVLTALKSKSAYPAEIIDTSIGKQGLMSYVFGLHLLNNKCASDLYTADDVIDKLISMQCSGGGWAIIGDVADVDATAMTLQALAPYYDREGVKAAIDAAIKILGERQAEDGDYLSYGSANPESTAQVMIALSALGIDCASDERFIKNGATIFDGLLKYRLENGGFCHLAGGEYSFTATVQVFLAIVSYLRMQDGKMSLYLLDSVFSDDEETNSASGDETSDIPRDDGATSGLPVAKETGDDSGKTEQSAHLKLWTSVAIVIIGALLCAVLVILKKRHRNNFIALAVVILIALAVVWLADIRTVDDYYSEASSEKENVIGSVTLTIRCDTIVGRAEHIPENGVILDVTEFDISDGDTVYTVLIEAAKQYKLHIENDGGAYVYISGIEYIYEFDFGDLSGWMYLVNGKVPSVGVGEYKLQDGDVVEWRYTCDLGEDIK